MKRFVSKVKNLSQKAAELQQAIQSVPPKIAELGQTVAMTKGQLQQLRAEVQSTATDLRADNEERLLDALREINGSVEVFQQAGFELGGVDLELSPVHRLIVHLNKVDDVSHSRLRSLMSVNQHHKTTHALLSALAQAETVADKVDLTDLTYQTLVVNVGAIPSVRLCWRPEEALEESVPGTAAPEAGSAASPVASVFGHSSTFFEPRSVQSTPATAPPATSPLEVVASSPVPEIHTEPESSEEKPAQAAAGGDWRREALDRFKKMPNVSKYRR
jgi:hypothetical protein